MARCVERGWVVSADLLYGLPDQDAEMLRDDIDRMVEVGIHGVSLYHLNVGPHNGRFMAMHGLESRGEDRLRSDFALLWAGTERLKALGFVRNHVAHHARPEDTNLYSRHAVRGEDLLAIGSSADGVFGSYFYRHVEANDYSEREVGPRGERSEAVPPLQGGGVYTEAEDRARPLVSALMAGEVERDCLDSRALAFCEGLEESGLLQRADGEAAWRLTTSGAWFSGGIATEAWALYEGS